MQCPNCGKCKHYYIDRFTDKEKTLHVVKCLACGYPWIEEDEPEHQPAECLPDCAC